VAWTAKTGVANCPIRHAAIVIEASSPGMNLISHLPTKKNPTR
jgi:hypothetical protein